MVHRNRLQSIVFAAIALLVMPFGTLASTHRPKFEIFQFGGPVDICKALLGDSRLRSHPLYGKLQQILATAYSERSSAQIHALVKNAIADGEALRLSRLSELHIRKAKSTEISVMPTLPYALANQTVDLDALVSHLNSVPLDTLRLYHIQDLIPILRMSVHVTDPSLRDLFLGRLVEAFTEQSVSDATRFFYLFAENIPPERAGDLQRLQRRYLSRYSDEPFYDRSVFDLALVSTVPVSLLSYRLAALFETDWGFSRSMANSAFTRPHVTILQHGEKAQSTGQCPQMWAQFNMILEEIDRDVPPRVVFVRLRGQLVGILKTTECGEPSLLGLIDVIDPLGRLVMVAGGVYNVSADTLKNQIGERLLARGGEVDLNSLKVRPLTFLLNRAAKLNGFKSGVSLSRMDEEQARQVWRDVRHEIRRFYEHWN